MENKDREAHIANLESAMNDASSKFFGARKHQNEPLNVKMFERGFEHGFNEASKCALIESDRLKRNIIRANQEIAVTKTLVEAQRETIAKQKRQIEKLELIY